MTNVDELDQIRTFLRANPDLHDQHVWQCGTTACVAGWTEALDRGCRPGAHVGYVSLLTSTPSGESAVKVLEARAQAILGLTDVEAVALFHETAERYPDDEDGEARVQALLLIDALIARDKGELCDADRDVLRWYGLPEEPQP